MCVSDDYDDGQFVRGDTFCEWVARERVRRASHRWWFAAQVWVIADIYVETA